MAGETITALLRLTGDSSGAEKALGSVESRLAPLKAKIDKVAAAGRTLSMVFGGLSVAGGALIKTTAQIAMRNEVLALSLHTIGDHAGYGRDELDTLVDQVKALGITTSQATQGITRMITGELDLARATEFARKAQSLAVVAGENSSETYGNLMDAVVSLQPRLLRKYGIVTTLNQALGDLADSNDVVAKRNRMFNFVLEEGEKYAGVYSGAMELVGKRITSIPRLLEEAKAAFGQHFLPVIGLGVDVLSKLLKIFQSLPSGVQRVLALIVLLGTGFSAVMAAVGGLAAALPFVISGLSAVAGAVAPMLPVLLAIGAAVGALVAAGALLAKAWEENWGGIRDAVTEAWNRIRPHLEKLAALARMWGEHFVLQARRIWNSVKALLVPVFERLAELIGSVDWSGMFGTLTDALNVIGRTIGAFLTTLNRLLRGEGLRAFRGLEDAAIDGLTLVALVFDKYVKKALVWGWNLIVNVANGISKAAQSILAKVMQFVGGVIGRFLAPGSPPAEGPLSNIVKWGRGVINTFLQAFGLADFGLLRRALAPIKSALESAMAAGDISGEEFVETFGRAREQTAELIAHFRKTGEISEEVLGEIADTLGEGSEEYVKFLRLQLEHQQALERLKSVQAEVAAAEAKGFVPQALKEKLKAAQDEADAAQEAVSWQEEYLAMQQESVDLQLRLVEALEQLGDVIGGLGRVEVEPPAAVGVGGEAGAAEVEIPDIGDFGDVSSVAEGLDDVQAKLGGLSDEFLKMRKRVKGWVDELKAWLGLPLDEKVTMLADKLTALTGIDFSGMLESFRRWLALPLDEKIKVIADRLTQATGIDFTGIFDRTSTFITTKLLPAFNRFRAGAVTAWIVVKNVVLSVASVFVDRIWPSIKRAFDNIGKAADEWGIGWDDVWNAAKKAVSIVANVIVAILLALVGIIVGIGTGIARTIEFVTGVFADWSKHTKQIIEGIAKILVAGWALIKGIFTGNTRLIGTAFRTWWEGIKSLVSGALGSITITLELAFGTLINLVSGFIEGFIGFFQDLYDRLIGESIITDLINAIETALTEGFAAFLSFVSGFVDDFVEFFQNLYDKTIGPDGVIPGLIEDIKDAFLNADWLAGGRAIVDGIKQGITDAWDGLLDKLGGLVSGVAASVLEGDWLDSMQNVGSAFVDQIKSGIASAWTNLVTWFLELLQKLRDTLGGSEPKDPRSPLRNLSHSGQALVENFAAGIDFSPVMQALQSELSRTRSALVGAGVAGGVSISQIFEGGLNFPNVRDGRDALGVRSGLQEMALEASMIGRTRIGV